MRYAITNNDPKSHHAPKRKRPLRNTYADQAPPPKTMLDSALETIPPTKFTIDHDQANRPVHRHSQTDQQDDARKQTSLLESIRLSNDARANDRVGHIHERVLEIRFWPETFALGVCMYICAIVAQSIRERNRRSFSTRQQGE